MPAGDNFILLLDLCKDKIVDLLTRVEEVMQLSSLSLNEKLMRMPGSRTHPAQAHKGIRARGESQKSYI
jgi:hypothetical protein